MTNARRSAARSLRLLLPAALATLAATFALALAGCGSSSTIQLVYGFVNSFHGRGHEADSLDLPTTVLPLMRDDILVREVWVGEAGKGRVSRFDFQGDFIKSFSLQGPSPSPRGMTLGRDLLIYIAIDDPNQPGNPGRIAATDTSGAVLRSIPLDPKFEPRGIAATQGLLFVTEVHREASHGGGQVEVFSETGNRLGVFGRGGSDSLVSPLGIAARDSSIWVCDPEAQKIREYRPDGRLVSTFGSPGLAGEKGKWNHPRNVAVTDDRHLLVVDQGNSRVQEYTAGGVYVTQFGAAQVGNPATFGIDAIGAGGSSIYGEFLYVSEIQSNRIYVVLRQYIRGSAKARLLSPAP